MRKVNQADSAEVTTLIRQDLFDHRSPGRSHTHADLALGRCLDHVATTIKGSLGQSGLTGRAAGWLEQVPRQVLARRLTHWPRGMQDCNKKPQVVVMMVVTMVVVICMM